MPNILLKNLNQTATYWANPVKDGYGGNTFTAPTTIDCRWSDTQELFIDAQGEEKLSRALVHVGQDLVPGEFLYLGTSTEANPKDVDGAWEIKGWLHI